MPYPKMKGAQITEARIELGKLWGVGRALYPVELGKALRLTGDANFMIQLYERGDREVKGPMAVAILMMLAGAAPPDPLNTILRLHPDGSIDQTPWLDENPRASRPKPPQSP